MKMSVVFVFLATLCLSTISAQPMVNEIQHGLNLLMQEEPELFLGELPQLEDSDEVVLSRSRRATCDLLSFSTSIWSFNHSACALRCLLQRKGFKGGRCKDGVCYCRK